MGEHYSDVIGPSSDIGHESFGGGDHGLSLGGGGGYEELALKLGAGGGGEGWH